MKTVKTVLITIISVACLGGAFALGMYTNKSLSKCPKVEVPKVEEPTNNYEKITVAQLQKYLNSAYTQASVLNTQKDSVLNVQELINNLDNQAKLSMVLTAILDENQAEMKTIPAASFLTKAKEVLNTDNLVLEDIKCICNNNYYNYDATTSTFKYNEEHGGHGGIEGIWTENEIIDIIEKNNIYTITMNKMYVEANAQEKVYDNYKDLLDGKATVELTEAEIYDTEASYKKKIKENNIIQTTYTYEIVKENGTIRILTYKIGK